MQAWGADGKMEEKQPPTEELRISMTVARPVKLLLCPADGNPATRVEGSAKFMRCDLDLGGSKDLKTTVIYVKQVPTARTENRRGLVMTPNVFCHCQLPFFQLCVCQPFALLLPADIGGERMPAEISCRADKLQGCLFCFDSFHTENFMVLLCEIKAAKEKPMCPQFRNPEMAESPLKLLD